MRYVIFFIQFIGSMFIASRLGPYYMGIWGFLLLILQYYSFVSIGADYSISILLVQNKNNKESEQEIVSSSFLIEGVQVSIIVLFSLITSIFTISYFEKYSFSSYIWLVCIIAGLTQFNGLFMAIYRIRNDIKKMLFYQGIIPFFALIMTFIFSKSNLVYFLLIIYIIGNLLAFIYFIIGFRQFSLMRLSKTMMSVLIRKGFFLLLFNMCFYFIIISIRTIVSSHYSIKEFGLFTFAFTIANSVFLLLEGFTFLAYPKLLDTFTKTNELTAKPKLYYIRTTFITLMHGIVYLAICFYPLLLSFIPEYKTALPLLNFITLSLLIKYNTVGYADTLVARDHEKKISKFSAIALFVNILIAIALIKIFNISLMYIIFSTGLAYLVYSFLVVYYGMKLYRDTINIKVLLAESFPLRLLLPYILAILATFIFPNTYSSVATLIIFILLNIKEIKEIKTFSMKLIKTPDILHI